MSSQPMASASSRCRGEVSHKRRRNPNRDYDLVRQAPNFDVLFGLEIQKLKGQ